MEGNQFFDSPVCRLDFFDLYALTSPINNHGNATRKSLQYRTYRTERWSICGETTAWGDH